MNEQQNEHEERLKQEIKTELCNQTFKCDIPHFMPGKVGNLVEILEIDEPDDEQEAAKAENRFEEFFQHKYYREIHHNRILKIGKHLVCTVAILALLFITADVMTKAVMQ